MFMILFGTSFINIKSILVQVKERWLVGVDQKLIQNKCTMCGMQNMLATPELTI